jgi:hypothetical protein
MIVNSQYCYILCILSWLSVYESCFLEGKAVSKVKKHCPWRPASNDDRYGLGTLSTSLWDWRKPGLSTAEMEFDHHLGDRSPPFAGCTGDWYGDLGGFWIKFYQPMEVRKWCIELFSCCRYGVCTTETNLNNQRDSGPSEGCLPTSHPSHHPAECCLLSLQALP